MTIGEIVRKRREELGFSTYEVALHLSLDEKHFKQIEANSVVPGMNVLRSICAALEIENHEELERERREQYMKRQYRRRGYTGKPSSMVPLANATPQPMKAQGQCEDHKCVPDPMLAKGHHRICVTVGPHVWSALEVLRKSMHEFSGVEPTLRSIIDTVILSVYEFKKNPGDKFTFEIRDFKDKI